MLSEDKILAGLRNGSHEAFRQIYDAYKFRIFSIILKLVGSKPAAEEIFQQTFVKLWENRGIINIHSSFSSYLNAIARNEVYYHWRTSINKKSLELSADGPLLSVSVIEDEMDNKDFRDYLFSLADGLPDKCRKVFDMRFMQQMSYREIAENLKISERTVENHVSKSLKHIREKLLTSGDIIIALIALAIIN